MTETTSPVLELFSQPWCDVMGARWDAEFAPRLADPKSFTYTAEFGLSDGEGVCQLAADQGRFAWWKPGRSRDGDEVDFILYGAKEHWQKVAQGKLDPIAAMTAKRLHLRKGPLEVAIKEVDFLKRLLLAFGDIPTAW
jgi:putative sterol carrier protein